MQQQTLWSDAFLEKKGGGFNEDNDDDKVNKHTDDKDHNDADKVDVRGGALGWAAIGGGKSNAVGCLPGRGVGLIPTTIFFDITTNLWWDAFLAGRGGGFDNYDSDKNNNDEQ